MALIAISVLAAVIILINSTVKNYVNSYTKVIVIDPGHGGIDGGASDGGVLEKDINLDIAQRLKTLLEQKDYKVIMTREKDESLDSLNNSSSSRHQRDLKARADIINNSKAQMFLSIHGNCHIRNPGADGSVVLYNERFSQSKVIAYNIQRALNGILIDGGKRTVHDPQVKTGLYLLNNTDIPGVIIETVFISNEKERRLLARDDFMNGIAGTILDGVDKYFEEIKNVEAIL